GGAPSRWPSYMRKSWRAPTVNRQRHFAHETRGWLFPSSRSTDRRLANLGRCRSDGGMDLRSWPVSLRRRNQHARNRRGPTGSRIQGDPKLNGPGGARRYAPGLAGPAPGPRFTAPRLRTRIDDGLLRHKRQAWLQAFLLRRRAGRAGASCGIAPAPFPGDAGCRNLFTTVSAAQRERGPRNCGHDLASCARRALGWFRHPKTGALDARAPEYI